MNEFTAFILDQLREHLDVHEKRMFGGYGLYCEDIFFAIISDDTLYFKINEKSKETYVQAGMKPFRASKKQTLTSYYEVPAEILEDTEELAQWAGEAIEAQIEHH